MIVFHELRLAIMTPPKCGTHALSAGLALPPHRGLCYCGPSRTAEDVHDWHTHVWPNEAATYRKLVVVRSPYERLVSLYAHHCADCSGRGQPAPGFLGYVTGVSEQAYAPFYWLTIAQWLDGVHYDGILRHESLTEDLRTEGIEVRRLPRLFASAIKKPHFAFYDAESLPLANAWAAADCEQFGYSAPMALVAIDHGELEADYSGESVTASATGGEGAE